MADPKKNPLIGAFRTPAPGSTPVTSTEGEPKTAPPVQDTPPKAAEPPKDAVPKVKADAPAHTSPGHVKKSQEPSDPEKPSTGELAKSIDEKKGAEASKTPTEEKEPSDQDGDKSKGKSIDIVSQVPVDEIIAKSLFKIDEKDPSFKELVEDIRKNGMKVPINVNRTADGKYEVIDGNRRLAAAKKLGMKTINATIMNLPDRLLRKGQFHSNLAPRLILEVPGEGGDKSPQLSDSAKPTKVKKPEELPKATDLKGKAEGAATAGPTEAKQSKEQPIIIDAEREYGDLTRALRGTVLEVSPNSPHHINPLDIGRGYGASGERPVAMKSELMMSLCEQQMGAGRITPFHHSIIDRCTGNIYEEFIRSGGKTRQPTLLDWRNEVKRQTEQQAQELALASELFVEGSLNMFAHETNVDIDNRIICFDLYEMGEQLKPTALNVTMETIQNRVASNRLAGKYTWVFIDEIYLFFKYFYSAQFLYKCWKRFRKYAAAMTGATQNVEECLRSETARLMFANSEFLILLNQAATDRAELAKLLNISSTQMGHVTGAEAGHGLLRV